MGSFFGGGIPSQMPAPPTAQAPAMNPYLAALAAQGQQFQMGNQLVNVGRAFGPDSNPNGIIDQSQRQSFLDGAGPLKDFYTRLGMLGPNPFAQNLEGVRNLSNEMFGDLGSEAGLGSFMGLLGQAQNASQFADLQTVARTGLLNAPGGAPTASNLAQLSDRISQLKFGGPLSLIQNDLPPTYPRPSHTVPSILQQNPAAIQVNNPNPFQKTNQFGFDTLNGGPRRRGGGFI